MALISKIRKNSWILVVLIGLGLGGFILMDMTSGQQSIFGSGQTIIGEVEGEKLDWAEFNRTDELLYGGSASEVYGRREALWNYFVEQFIVNKEASNLGLGVGREELRELEFGQNLSPVIVQRFSDPNVPGMVNRQQLEFFRQVIDNNQMEAAIQAGQLNPTFPSFWRHQEKEIIKDRLQSKLIAVVSKGMYTPSWVAERMDMEQNHQIDFSYVQIPFNEVTDEEINLTDADYENFLEKNQASFNLEEEQRNIEFVTFEVNPISEDSILIKEKMESLIPELRNTDNLQIFLEQNYGIYDEAYYSRAQLPESIADLVFEMEVGSVNGPFIDQNTYKAIKLTDKKIVPDSVKSRHILISATNPAEFPAAQQRVDSLIALLEAGTHSFDSLAAQYGSDGTRTTGGDLGYVANGTMVKPFNDLIFFQAEPGQYYTVTTDFGVHLVEVTGRRYTKNTEAVQLAILSETIVPSEDTQNEMYDQVLEFTSNNRTIDDLRKSVEGRSDLYLETASSIKKNDYNIGSLGGGQSSRDLVRWAFSEEIGKVSPEIYIYQDPINYYNNKYVVAGIVSIQKSGIPSLASMKDEIMLEVMNDKKGQLLTQAISGKSLEETASSYSTSVEDATGVTLSSSFVPGMGNEPKVIAAAFSQEVGEISEAIIGNNGVYLVKTERKPALPAATNTPNIKRAMITQNRSIAALRLLESMKKDAEIKDNRFRFY